MDLTSDIPSVEPASLVAGDTLSWTKSLSHFPADAAWVLSYRLINAAAKIDIVASASGKDHLVSVAAAVTAAYPVGVYTYQAFVTKAAARHTVGSGSINISPNLAAQAASYDTRSAASKILDSLIVSYQSASTNRAFVMEYEVAGRRMKFNAKTDWIIEIDYWKRQVAAEERAASINAGRPAANKLLVRLR